jgi:transposase
MVNSSNPKALQEKFQEVFSDETFAKDLLQMEDASDVQKTLEEKGIELTLDEIRRIKEHAIKVQNGKDSQEQPDLVDGELSEDELMDVAGGDGWTLQEIAAWFGSW